MLDGNAEGQSGRQIKLGMVGGNADAIFDRISFLRKISYFRGNDKL